MSDLKNTIITIETSVMKPVEDVWEKWTTPEHIIKWNAASPEWHTKAAELEFIKGGKFSYRMEARDGSIGFNFEGIFDKITPLKLISYKTVDGRSVKTTFSFFDNRTFITQSFEAETEHAIQDQQKGWQAILDNFKFYTESLF